MGVVAECTHLALNERVAVKMLRPDVMLDYDAVQRFIREAQAAVKLKSEYVARVSDVGTFENGTPYMVMEFLEGLDVGELLEERGVLPAPWASELVLQTCEALAEAHSLGIVHRDIKPTNLFVTWRPDGSALIKVLDFGISKAPIGTDMQLTQTQSLLGTPAYMSPEQMRSARLVDTRTDIWSLGTVLYEILEGRRPFEAESFSEMCVKVAVDPPAPMVNAPPALQAVIMRCLAKTPEQRYANMAELGRDLIPFVQDQHQGQMLVERMQRMLRRSHVEWEGGTGVNRAPLQVRDAHSAPVRIATPNPAWGGGSDPVDRPWHGKSEPIGVPYNDGSSPQIRVPEDASSPVATISTIHTRKRRWPVILVGFAVTAAASIGVALAISSGGGDEPRPEPPSTVDTKAVDTKAAGTADTKAADTKAADTKAADTKAADTKAADTKAADTKAVDTKAVDTKAVDPVDTKAAGTVDTKVVDTKVDAIDTKAADTKHGTHPHGKDTKSTTKSTKATTGTGSKDNKATTTTAKTGPNALEPIDSGTAKDTKDTKDTKATVKDAKDPKDGKTAPCNPFDSMHGCK
jgi:serine/threonine-protein kinase